MVVTFLSLTRGKFRDILLKIFGLFRNILEIDIKQLLP